MAITYKGGNRLAGLSSDTKPTADGEHINGSTFIETDTGKEYILNYGDWTETNQPSGSIGELLDDYSEVRKKRFWYWFSGYDIENRWTEKTSGSGTYNIAHSIDGGLDIASGTGNGNYNIISFGDVGATPVRQFDGANSTFIAVVKHTPNSNGYATVGLHENPASAGQYITAYIYPNNTYVKLNSNGASSDSVDTNTAGNTQAWHVYKGESGSSKINLSVDGVLEATQSTAAKIPTVGLMPYADCAPNSTGVSHHCHIRYYEAYNT